MLFFGQWALEYIGCQDTQAIFSEAKANYDFREAFISFYLKEQLNGERVERRECLVISECDCPRGRNIVVVAALGLAPLIAGRDLLQVDVQGHVHPHEVDGNGAQHQGQVVRASVIKVAIDFPGESHATMHLDVVP